MPALSTAFAQGTLAARPAASTSNSGYFYLATDQNGGTLYQSSGSLWVQLAAPVQPPAVRCYNSAVQNVPHATYTTLTFDTNRYDQGTLTPQHSTSSNPSRLVCQEAGIYNIIGAVGLTTGTDSTWRQAAILLNGSITIAMVNLYRRSDGQGCYGVVSTHYQLSVGDYVELVVYQDSGGALSTVVNHNLTCEFMMARTA